MKLHEILAFLCILISIPLIGTWWAVGLAVLGVSLFFACRPSKLEKALRKELHYPGPRGGAGTGWQMRVRLDIRSLQRTIQKTKEIATQLRQVQKEHRKKS